MTGAPETSIRNSSQADLPYGTCRTTPKGILQMFPYRITVMHEIFPPDFPQTRHYYIWFSNNIDNDEFLVLPIWIHSFSKYEIVEYGKQLGTEKKFCFLLLTNCMMTSWNFDVHQDGTTAHSAQNTLNLLRQYFGQRISRNTLNIQPSRPCDLTPLNFFIQSDLKILFFKRSLII
ncbi:hypothetical protein BDFB_010664 [Asbolus verrucosus]|uniref:DDE 3 domain containing protein n=1 Tax=Asbolus verrucosus TaxID=1661398 RepID=A0A482VH22_ASBVE|nr:hypothetical protein BDFB_010664 [Asbolus verrucosus]